MRRLPVLAAAMWSLSWFALYLEIYRFHHVVVRHLGSVLWPAVSGGMRPGGFVRTVVASSVVAPLLTAVLVTLRRRDGLAEQTNGSLPSEWLLLTCGAMLAIMGLANQLIRRPPWVVDLTLRTGNGGFVVLGILLASISAWTQYHRRSDRRLKRTPAQSL